jgi:hypothetical protein
MFRLALIISLLFTFTVVTQEGPGMCPHGGKSGTNASSDRGAGLDPNGGVHTSSIAGDKGLGVDPNG